MSGATSYKATKQRCAVYTRKSSEEGLDQAFNSLQAQREACEAYIQSQRHEGWQIVRKAYDDGGFSGSTVERPALKALLDDIRYGKIEIVIVYKVDRLSRSLADFVRLVELFDRYGVSFVSVTQQFNTSTSMGRLTLNVLLSFAQFEREVTGERIRDKIAASKKKGMWMGGVVPLGYDVVAKQLVINKAEAALVRHIHERYLALGCVRRLKAELDDARYLSKARMRNGTTQEGKPFSRGALYKILSNPLYVGRVAHAGKHYVGTHEPILDETLWGSVRQRLNENRIRAGLGAGAKDPSPLAGLLFDDCGNPMSPTHSRKGARKYRYYVSQAVLQYRARDAGSVERVPAQTVEDLVVEQMMAFLRNPAWLHAAMRESDLTAPQSRAATEDAQALADGWNALPSKDQLRWLRGLIGRVVLGRKQLEIQFSPGGLRQALLPDSLHGPKDADQPYTVTIGVDLTRCKHEMRLLPSAEHRIPPPSSAQRTLQQAVAQAYLWNEELVEGRVSSVSELAKRKGVTQRYVARLLRLAYLSPDIVAAIVQGDIPPTLTLERIKKGFSLNWQSQSRELLALDPR